MTSGTTRGPRGTGMPPSFLLVLTSICALCGALFYIPPGTEPILLAVLVGLLFVSALKWRNGGVVPLEIGSFYFGIVFLYTTIPFIAFAINGFEYHILSDNRLYHAGASASEVSRIGLFFVLYLGVFAASYVSFRRSSRRQPYRQKLEPSVSMIGILAVAYVFLELPVFLLKLQVLGWNAHQSYTDEYLWVAQYPLFVRQFLNHWQAIGITLQLFIITYLFLIYRRTKFIIGALLLFKLLALLFLMGARTEFAVLLGASVVCYFNYARRPSLAKFGGVAIVSIGTFLLLGLMRDYQIAGLDLTGMAIPATEFEVVFGNAYDIFYQKQLSGVDPPGLYQIEGLLNLFPQQIFPIEKPNLSRWYADTFYPEYALLGGGFGFGVIAEALLSDTPVVAVAWRAVFHGVLLAMAFNAFKGSRQRPVQVAAYVWVTVLTYQIFRDTTFALVPKLLFDLFPAVAIVYLILLVARAQRQESGAS